MTTVKRIKYAGSFLLATCWFIIISGLISCNANKSNIPATQKYNQTFDSANQKVLPEVSIAEYESTGDRFLSTGDLAQAFLQYEKALQLDPTNSSVRYKKGLSLIAGKIYEDAIEEFQAVIKNDSSYAPAHEGLGLAYFRIKKYKKSEKKFREALELNPKLWKSHNFLGNIYDRQKKI